VDDGPSEQGASISSIKLLQGTEILMVWDVSSGGKKLADAVEGLIGAVFLTAAASAAGDSVVNTGAEGKDLPLAAALCPLLVWQRRRPFVKL